MDVSVPTNYSDIDTRRLTNRRARMVVPARGQQQGGEDVVGGDPRHFVLGVGVSLLLRLDPVLVQVVRRRTQLPVDVDVADHAHEVPAAVQPRRLALAHHLALGVVRGLLALRVQRDGAGLAQVGVDLGENPRDVYISS